MENNEMKRLSKDEAAVMQWKLIYEWPTPSDTWPFNYGLAAISVSTIFSSVYVSYFFKRKFKLGSFGNFSLMIPSVFVPPVILPMLHQKMVTEPILLQSECPVCIQFRALMIQNIVGIGYPLLMAPITSIGMAHSFGTMRLPEISFRTIPDLYDMVMRMSRPLKIPLMVLFALNSAIAVYISNQEALGLFSILDKLDSGLVK